MTNTEALLNHLLGVGEVTWLEFKENNSDPKEIGEYVSALSNSAALAEEQQGYIVWGVRNADRRPVGTTFNPDTAKKGNEGLRNWLSRAIEPKMELVFHRFLYESKNMVILEIPRASNYSTRFNGQEFIRLGEHKKKLKDHPELEKRLWAALSETPFERDVAVADVSEESVLELLDFAGLFALLKEPLPERRGIIERLIAERFLIRQQGSLNITNLGAIACAKDISKFSRLSRKAVRLVLYKGTDRLEVNKEITGAYGYAIGFVRLVDFLKDRLPANEAIESAIRKEVEVFPIVAVRELIANALIHQDFTITGTGPLIEVFLDRIEITNPGTPLVDVERFLDMPPRSRNEQLAKFMRRCGYCEERGSGIDRVVNAAEMFQLPPPDFQVIGEQTRAILYAPKTFADMGNPERVRACYQHACLMHVSGKRMKNATLRNRFGLDEKNKAQVSRVIRDATEEGLIVDYDPNSGLRKRSYVPYWAAPS